MTTEEKDMKEALKQGKKAYALKEVPVGCVIVYEDQIIARGYNRRNTDQNTTSHAEINAIRKASKKLGDWRLEGCTIYITMEPVSYTHLIRYRSGFCFSIFTAFAAGYGKVRMCQSVRESR